LKQEQQAHLLPRQLFAALVVAALVLPGCSQKAETARVVTSEFNHCQQASCSSDLVNKYHVADQVWRTDVVQMETVLPIDQGKKQDEKFDLWRQPKSILSVAQRDGKAFVGGRDYVLSGGALLLKRDGEIPFVPKSYLYQENGKVRITEEIQDKQLRVSYETDTQAPAPTPTKPLAIFPEKLRRGDKVFLTFYGDSITQGWGSDQGASYADLTAAYLASKYPGQIYWRNKGVAGWTSRNGLRNLDERVNTTSQDLVVIAFGMNDAAFDPHGLWALVNGVKELVGRGETGRFKRDTLSMISSIREKNPNTEFILVSGIRSNPAWGRVNNNLIDQYRKDMREIENQVSGVSVVDVTSVWDSLMQKKSFDDVGSNGVNHPNAFGHLIYAQCLIDALIKDSDTR
jgi:lysophospholipase L1-like esterase